MTNEQLHKIIARHAAAMRNEDVFAMDEFLDQVQHDIPTLVAEVERLNERITTLQEIITGHNSNLNPNLEQENPYSNETPENGITRGDRIRAMTDEELAKWMSEMCDWVCHEHCAYADDESCTNRCEEGALTWLRQPEGE